MVSVRAYRPLLLGLAVAALLVPTILGGSCGPLPAPLGDGTDNTGNPGDGSGDGSTAGKFVGAERCAECHSNRHQGWSATAHAQAFQVLVTAGQSTNAECLPCHTVGFQAGGFVDDATTKGLEGVQCESCHGGALDHVQNVEDKSLRPTVSIGADVCGRCHTDAHHPTVDEWAESGHGKVVEEIAEELNGGTRADSCGECHSGDARYATKILGDKIGADFLKGVPVEKLNGITCAICHDPHARTGNAAAPADGADYQLRYAEVTSPEPTNDITTITTASRYNLCGQCHHDRGAEWTAPKRGSHHSIQSNVYIGEMPIKAGMALLVPNTRSVHRFVPEQCSTCHMHRTAAQGDTPADTGHKFELSTAGCSATGCHPNEADAIAVKNALQAEVQGKLDNILARLGDPTTWDYPPDAGVGPTDQTKVPEPLRKVRFLMNYVSYDGSKGVHNPAYVRTILAECDRLLTSAGRP